MRFCLQREDKASVCRELEISHFIDDRVHIMHILRGVVPHLCLFGEPGGEKFCPPWASFASSWPEVVGWVSCSLQPKALLGLCSAHHDKGGLAELCFRKEVRVIEHGRDRYGRTIGIIYVNDLDVNAEQLRRGMAWAYLRYLRDRNLVTIEQEARTARRGLWADHKPVPPWEWRRRPRAAPAP